MVLFVCMSQVPLADDAGVIAGGAKAIGYRRLTKRQPDFGCGIGWWAGVEFMAEPLLVSSGHQPGPRRRTVGVGHISVGALYAVLRQRIDVRRGDILTSVNPQVAIAQIVRDDHDDI